MDRISTSNAYSSVLLNLMRAQNDQNTAGNQVSTGKAATDLKGYAVSAETLTATRTVKARVDGFINQADALSARLNTQDMALTATAGAADNARQSILSAIALSDGTGLRNELQSWFSSAVTALNTQHGGHYLFSGGQVDTAPVAATSMSDLTAGTVADVFKNDALTPTSRVDDATTIQTGFVADKLATGLFTAFQQVQAYLDANGGDFPAKLDPAAVTFLTGVVGQFQAANTELTNAAGQNGLMQTRVDDAKTAQVARQTLLTNTIGDVADVDMADAVSRLQLAQTATQASAKVFQTLQNSSLLNFLQ